LRFLQLPHPQKMNTTSLVHVRILILIIVTLLVETSATGAPAWHNHLMRSPWERDRNLTGGDGTQLQRAIVYSPKNNYQTVFMGIDTAGVYRSDDGGASWTSKMKGMGVYFVKSLAVDPVNPDIVYALASISNTGVQIPQNGLYVSLDNGDNWTLQSNFNVTRPPDNTHTIAIDGSSYNPEMGRCQTIYVGTSTGLYKTVNGGLSYSNIGAGTIGAIRITSIDIHPGNSAIVTVATFNGVFRSIDSGVTFSDISSGLPTFDSTYQVAVDSRVNALAVDPVDPDVMYATFDDPLAKTYRLFKKTGTNPWQQLTSGVPTKGRFHDIIVHPAARNRLMLGVEWGWPFKHPYYSEDYGQTWEDTSPGKIIEDRFNLSDGDVANFIYGRTAFTPKPNDANTWLAGLNYGAIFKTTDAAITWNWSNTNYGGARFANFAFNNSAQRHMSFAGTDMGVVTSFDGGQSFRRAKIVNSAGGGHGTAVGIAPGSTVPETAYLLASIGGTNATARGMLEESIDGGLTFTPVPGTEGTQAAAIFWHPNNSEYIYAGTMASNNGGDTWTPTADTFRLNETFTSAIPPNLPSGWAFSTIGQQTSSAQVITNKAPNISDNKIEFTINQTTAFGSIPLVDYTAKLLSFTTTPILASATLDAGSSGWTQQVLQLDNSSGSYIYVFVQNNGNGTYSSKYRIKDGAYDSGEQTINSTLGSSSVTAQILLAPKYVRFSAGTGMTIFHNFTNKNGYKLRLAGRSSQINTPIKTYADNIVFNMLPLQIVGYDLSNPNTIYGYDSMSIYKSTDLGATWNWQLTHATPDNGLASQLLAATAMNQSGTKIYMGHNGGVYIYDIATNTESFKTTSDGFVLNQGGGLHIARVAIDPNNEQIVYAGEINLIYGNGKWVFRSMDGGESWSEMPSDGFFGNGRVWGLNVDPAGRVFVGSDHGPFWYGEIAAPQIPTGLTVIPTNGAASVSWNATAGATTYQVERSASVNGPYYVVKGGVSDTNYSDTGVESGVTYYYRVYASNLGGYGGSTTSAPVTTSQALMLDAPFSGTDGTLPAGWTYSGSSLSSASINGNLLRHVLNPSAPWAGTSKVTFGNQYYEFFSAPLWVEAFLDCGVTPISQSGIQMTDSLGNFIQLIQSGARVRYRVKDGSYDSGEIDLGPQGSFSFSTLKMKVEPTGVTIFHNGAAIYFVNHNFTNRWGYLPELLGRCGTVGSNIMIMADNFRIWKEGYVSAIDGTPGGLPAGWENTGAASSPGSIVGSALRLTINQSAAFAANAAVTKTDRTFDLSLGGLNIEAYLRADPFTGTATQCMLTFQKMGTPNKIYLFVQTSGAVVYRIVDGEYDSGEVSLATTGNNAGVFRLQVSNTGISVYRDGVLLGSPIAHTFANQSEYSVGFTGRCSSAASNVYVTVDDVNIY
jgi:hypothetical protein